MFKKVILTMGIIILLLIAAAGGYVYDLYHSVQSTANKIYQPVKQTGGKAADPMKKQPAKAINLLLMGVDQRPGDSGRSDTLIDMTLNPKTKTMQMISIPRDTRTIIIGKGTVDKINAAYADGGPGMAMNTVEHFINVPINYYIRINMQGLSQLVDAVGGVTVNNDLDWVDKSTGFHYHPGAVTMNGKQALAFVRMRHQDPRGDFGRNLRQREVIMAVVNKMANVSSVSHYSAVLQAVQDNIRTNLTFDDMKNIAANYRDVRQRVKMYEIQGQGAMLYDSRYNAKEYYMLVTQDERQKVHNMIMDGLNLVKTSG